MKRAWIFAAVLALSGCGGPRVINLDRSEPTIQDESREKIEVPFAVASFMRSVSQETDSIRVEGSCPIDHGTVRVYLDSLYVEWGSAVCVKNRFSLDLETAFVPVGTHVVFFVLEQDGRKIQLISSLMDRE